MNSGRYICFFRNKRFLMHNFEQLIVPITIFYMIQRYKHHRVGNSISMDGPDTPIIKSKNSALKNYQDFKLTHSWPLADSLSNKPKNIHKHTHVCGMTVVNSLYYMLSLFSSCIIIIIISYCVITSCLLYTVYCYVILAAFCAYLIIKQLTLH